MDKEKMVKEYIKNHILLFDGGMGTYFAQKNRAAGVGCELANLSQPDLIAEIHREYLEAGCSAIKTNTFAANRITFQGDEELVRQTIAAAWEIANKAVEAAGFDFTETKSNQNKNDSEKKSVESSAFVFADIGPISNLTEHQDAFTEYRFVADLFLELGARNFLLETNANTDGLREIATYIKEKAPEAFLIVSFAVQPDGFSRDGRTAAELLGEMTACLAVDAVGLNCVSGAHHMRKLVDRLSAEGLVFGKISDEGAAKKMDADNGRPEEQTLSKPILLSVMPNAGYPIVVDNRTIYEGDPVYFAEQMAEMADAGAVILGGCCGTTPVHIAKTKLALEKRAQALAEAHVQELCLGTGEQKTIEVSEKKTVLIREESDSYFWNKLKQGEKVVAVELDSPANADVTKFMKGAWELKSAGADIITIADCPIARARMDSSLLACKIRRELNMDALPHMTCRDRNLNATKALLLGLYAEGIRNVLLVTGDPIPSAERDEVKSVYQFNSRKLAAFVTSLGEQALPSPFHLFGALNVNARNFDVQIRLAKQKEENGIIGFLTQPVLTEMALTNIKRAKEELHGYILGGVIPVVSAKNARFMDSEINGINVDSRITELYEGKNRAESEDLAVKISTEIMRRISPYVDGYYLMTPFGRTGLIARILKAFAEESI